MSSLSASLHLMRRRALRCLAQEAPGCHDASGLRMLGRHVSCRTLLARFAKSAQATERLFLGERECQGGGAGGVSVVTWRRETVAWGCSERGDLAEREGCAETW